MDGIAVVGANWKQASPERLAALAGPVEERAERLQRLVDALRADEAVFVATCNRVEVVFRSSDPDGSVRHARRTVFRTLLGLDADPGEAERALQHWAGEGAAEHLFLVAAGIDSARPGEREIAGQIRRALQSSRELGLAGGSLGRLIDDSLRIAARVHQLPVEGNRGASFADLAIERARDHLGAAERRSLTLIGVSPMTERCARHLAPAVDELIIVNRTLARAESLAQEFGAKATARELTAWQTDPPATACAVFATASEQPVTGATTLEALHRSSPTPPLLIDLAVPADVDAEAAEAIGMKLIDMNALLTIARGDNRQHLLGLAEARALVDDALDRLRTRLAERQLAPMLSAVQRRYQHTANEGAERLLRRELAGLGEAEQDAVRRFAQTLARRFAHIPVEGLKAVAANQGLDAAQAFLDRADAEIADEVRRARNENDQ